MGDVVETERGTKGSGGEGEDSENGDIVCVPEDEDEEEGGQSQDEEMGDPDDAQDEEQEPRADSQTTLKTGRVLVRRVKVSAQTAKVHCANKAAYWCGMIALIEDYWTGVRISVWIIWAGKWQYAVRIGKSAQWEGSY